MYKFSKQSELKLQKLHKDLQKICTNLIKIYDFTILETYRNKESQDKAFRDGKSKLQFPNSKHNKLPSLAVDIAPYPIDWNDRESFIYMAGLFLGIASQLNIKVRWGGDWNQNNKISDETFLDLPHFELIE